MADDEDASAPPVERIYAIEGGGYVKIGISFSPEDRIAALQTGNPHQLRLVGSIPGSKTIEKAIHALLQDSGKHGEWFEPTDEVGRVVDIIASQDVNGLEKLFD